MLSDEHLDNRLRDKLPREYAERTTLLMRGPQLAVNIIDLYDRTPLTHAVPNFYQEIMNMLISH